MLVPPYCFIWVAILFMLAFATVFGMNRYKCIVLTEYNQKHPIFKVALTLALTNSLAVIISTIFMFILSGFVPYFENVNSEWGVRYTQLFWNPGTVYLILWTLLAILITVGIYLRKESTILSKKMNRLILTVYLIEFGILWLLSNGYIYLILLRDTTRM